MPSTPSTPSTPTNHPKTLFCLTVTKLQPLKHQTPRILRVQLNCAVPGVGGCSSRRRAGRAARRRSRGRTTLCSGRTRGAARRCGPSRRPPPG
eukprot:7022866-Prymnesium_polylepis.1